MDDSLLITPGNAVSSAPTWLKTSLTGRRIHKTEARIAHLLQQMTLEEKVGQMTQFSIGTPTGPGTGRSDYKEMVAKGQVGSILNMSGAAQTNAMQKIAVEQSRLHIPLIFGLDIIHGYRTSFPIPLGLSASWNPELDRARSSAHGAGGQPRRHSLDVLAHGRHRARCTLGPHC